MPVNITPEYEKIWKYFSVRKTPVTVKQVMKALLVSEAHARRALEYFVFVEIADRIRNGSKYSYRIKE